MLDNEKELFGLPSGVGPLASLIILPAGGSEYISRSPVILVVLDKGADLSETHEGNTLWQCWVTRLHVIMYTSIGKTYVRGWTGPLKKVFEHGIKSGPGWDVCCLQDGSRSFGWVSDDRCQRHWRIQLKSHRHHISKGWIRHRMDRPLIENPHSLEGVVRDVFQYDADGKELEELIARQRAIDGQKVKESAAD
jgi:hypothetical protein